MFAVTVSVEALMALRTPAMWVSPRRAVRPAGSVRDSSSYIVARLGCPRRIQLSALYGA